MIDVNGTRYHLLLGEDDWMRSGSEGDGRRWEYDPERHAVRLQAEVYTFQQRGPRVEVLTPEDRRGAARDAYGHWYWISDDEQQVLALWAAASTSTTIFPVSAEGCDPPHNTATFRPAQEVTPGTPERLVGLTVINDGYLVVGSPDTSSLLVFDLYSLDGGFVRVTLRPSAATGESAEPFDLAALPDGGLLVLDRAHRLVWRLDSAFRPVPVRPRITGDPLVFQPRPGRERRGQVPPLADVIDLDATNDPIAIDPLPDGSFWVLDRPAAEDDESPSVLWRYSMEDAFVPQSIALNTGVLVDEGADDLDLRRIRGHDIAYVPDRLPTGYDLQKGTLFIADVSGNQAYALRVDLSGDAPQLRISRRYFPMRSFNKTAIVSVWTEGETYYHQRQRWLPIKALPQMRFEGQAILLVRPLDGREPNCVWHRLCLDACIPPETNIWVETRVAETVDDLQWQGWQAQPRLYKRPEGSEIPYSNLWSDADLERPYTGTWELLFQSVQGRYLELRLTLDGNGRSTPVVRALRAQYPRFSYVRRYLPPLYQQDRTSMQFLENFLANPEGIFTKTEGLIAQIQYLLDVATVPADALEWLAGWLGLVMLPGWDDYQRRLLLANASYFFQRRGTLPGLMQAILLTIYPQMGPRIFQDDINSYCSRVRVVEQFLTRRQPGVTLGDSTDLELSTTESVEQDARNRAHRFTVILPTSIDETKRRLVEHIVNLEKPAHTSFSIKQYWALFRVGEARLGLDTVLGQGGRFETFQLGSTALAEGVLGAAFPYNLTTRTVIAK